MSVSWVLLIQLSPLQPSATVCPPNSAESEVFTNMSCSKTLP